jgi:Glycosyl transferase family 2
MALIIGSGASAAGVALALSQRSDQLSERFLEGGHLGFSRNTAVDLARGEVIAFLDDDDADWREWLLAPYDDPQVGVVGGEPIPAFEAGPPGWLPREFYWLPTGTLAEIGHTLRGDRYGVVRIGWMLAGTALAGFGNLSGQLRLRRSRQANAS